MKLKRLARQSYMKHYKSCQTTLEKAKVSIELEFWGGDGSEDEGSHGSKNIETSME